MFPTAFSLLCFLAFGPPLVSTLWLAGDPSVVYWIGGYGYATALVPIIFSVCHILHLRAGKPVRNVVLLATLVPSTIFIVTANIHIVIAGDLATRLLSSDCTTFERKRELETEWKEAQKAYHGCLGDTAPNLGLSVEDTVQIFRIHHCEEYEGNFTNHKQAWSYLRYLEEHQACSGWCHQGQRLWTFNKVVDSCSIAAGTILQSKVQRIAGRTVAYTALALIVTLV